MRPVFVLHVCPSGSGWEAEGGWWPQLGGKGKSHAGGLKTVTLKYGVTPLRLPGRAGPLLPRKELVERKTCEPPEEVWSLRLGNVHLFFQKRKRRTSQPSIYTPSGSHRQTMLSGQIRAYVDIHTHLHPHGFTRCLHPKSSLFA